MAVDGPVAIVDSRPAGLIWSGAQRGPVIVLPHIGQTVDNYEQIPIELAHEMLGSARAPFSFALDCRNACNYTAGLHVGSQPAVDHVVDTSAPQSTITAGRVVEARRTFAGRINPCQPHAANRLSRVAQRYIQRN